MTKKKTPVPPAWAQSIIDANFKLYQRIDRLEEQANALLAAKEPTNQESVSETINEMARARGKKARRHATPGGPNFPDDIYPPGCGPLQLVWQTNMRLDSQGRAWPAEITIGTQGDSFHGFPDRLAAVDWLLGIAQRIINDKLPEG